MASTIDWCENNYSVLSSVAEFWNTTSSLAMLLPAFAGLWLACTGEYEFCCVCQFACLVVVSLGTAAFHGTLTYAGQMVDEVGMMVGVFNWLHSLLSLLCRHKGQQLPQGITLSLVLWVSLFSIVHVVKGFVDVFQLHFALCTVVGLVLLARVYSSVFTCDAQKSLVRLYLTSLLCGVVPWQLELMACESLQTAKFGNPQLHAWWHVVMGFHCYVGGMLLQSAADAAEAKAYSRPARPVHYVCWIVPYCGRKRLE